MTVGSTRLSTRLAALAAAGALLLTGCSSDDSQAENKGPANDSVVIIVSVHQGAPAPDLTQQLLPLLTSAVQANAPVSVIALDGTPSVTPVPPPSHPVNTSNPQSMQDDTNRQLNVIIGVVQGASADSDGDDLGAALAIAADQVRADGASNAAVIVLDSGLSDRGAPAMTTAGITETDPQDVVDFAVANNQVPSFPGGTTVYLVGLGYGADPQPALTAGQRDNVTAIWKGIAEAGGASVEVIPTPRSGEGPDTPFTTTPVAAADQAQFTVTETSTGVQADLASDVLFAPDSATLLPEASAMLSQLLELVAQSGGSVAIEGHTDVGASGYPGGVDALSLARADSVKQWLVAQGADAARISTVGLGSSAPVYASPQTDAEHAANRRVTVQISN